MQSLTIFVLAALAIASAIDIVEDDNIALPQENVPHFVVPAPGLRFTAASSKKRIQRQNYPAITPSIGVGSNVIGNLLPLEPRQAMPTITTLEVSCNSNYMRVQIGFDSPFPGLIYSKGFYGQPECLYVKPGSSRSLYTFDIGGQNCGTKFAEPSGKASYMENVIIIQNEPGIQEIWDTARGIRCMLDAASGKSRKTVSAALNVAMLDQQVVSFRSDTQASASMDIQVGRGPFAPTASGLVKIGELMTMVVAVDGPNDVDLLVRQCVAHDGTDSNVIQLTDENGCVLKKKILGSWQKAKNSDTSGVVAYSHFQAFKFPDRMDVYIECEIDLCSGGCPVCNDDQTSIPGRKKRALPSYNEVETIKELEDAIDDQSNHQSDDNSIKSSGHKNRTDSYSGLRLARRLRVLSPDDITIDGQEFSTITLVSKTNPEDLDGSVCMSLTSFVVGLVVMLIILIMSSVLTAILCIRVRTIPSLASSFPPDSSFHAFSTVSGKNT